MLQMVAVAPPAVGEREVIGPVRLGETFEENTWAQHDLEAPASGRDAARKSAAEKMERERPGALLARRTRTKNCGRMGQGRVLARLGWAGEKVARSGD